MHNAFLSQSNAIKETPLDIFTATITACLVIALGILHLKQFYNSKTVKLRVYRVGWNQVGKKPSLVVKRKEYGVLISSEMVSVTYELSTIVSSRLLLTESNGFEKFTHNLTPNLEISEPPGVLQRISHRQFIDSSIRIQPNK